MSVPRANLTLYIVIVSIAALVMLGTRGLLDTTGLVTALVLAPLFFGGVIVGSRVFAHVSERRFRQFTHVLLMAVSLGIMVA